MDPVSALLLAALQLANTIAEIVKFEIEAQPPEQRAELARQRFKDLQAFREFFDSLRPRA